MRNTKEWKKGVVLVLTGAAVSLFVYPFLHEIGHCLLALMSGAEILEMKLFPLPEVMCSTVGLEREKIALIGYGGLLFPSVFAVVFRPRGFFLWYAFLMVKLINLLSAAISFAALAAFLLGDPLKNEDVTTVLTIMPEAAAQTFLIIVFCFFITLFSTKNEKILEKCEGFIYAGR